MMKLTIGHLYPDLLNLYGDRGNIQCMTKRSLWRGIEAETIEFSLEDHIDFSNLDIVLLGGGLIESKCWFATNFAAFRKILRIILRTAAALLPYAAATSF